MRLVSGAAALLLLAPAGVRAQGTPPATTLVGRFAAAMQQRLSAYGYNFSAFPPDFSANLNFAPEAVPSASPYVDQVLALADAATADTYASIPGEQRCLCHSLRGVMHAECNLC